MKRIAVTLVAGWVLFGVPLPVAWGNHGAGTKALTEIVVTGDFSEDGHLDLAVINSGLDHVAILIGDGTGGFALKGHIPADTLPSGMDTADINRDGHLDLVVSNQWGYNTLIFVGDGLGGFSLAGDFDMGEPAAIALKDFNEDGAIDMAVHERGLPAMSILLADGVGGFGGPVTLAQDTSSPSIIASGDFNGDSHLDIPVLQQADISAFLLLGDGLGGFSQTAPTPLDVAANARPTSVVVGDLDEDSTLDLVVAGSPAHNDGELFLAMLFGDGTGNFPLMTTLSAGQGTLKGNIAIADFNEDAHLDLAVGPTNFQTSIPSNLVLVFLGDGTGGFGPATTFQVGLGPHTVTVGDFNEDGHSDLAVSNRQEGTVSILVGDGTGSFSLVGTFSTVDV